MTTSSSSSTTTMSPATNSSITLQLRASSVSLKRSLSPTLSTASTNSSSVMSLPSVKIPRMESSIAEPAPSSALNTPSTTDVRPPIVTGGTPSSSSSSAPSTPAPPSLSTIASSHPDITTSSSIATTSQSDDVKAAAAAELKVEEEKYDKIIVEYADHFSRNDSALVWLARSQPSRSLKLAVPKPCRWPKSTAGQGGYASAFRALGLQLREVDTKLGHWHAWYLDSKDLNFKALQNALRRRWKASPNYNEQAAELVAMLHHNSRGMGHVTLVPAMVPAYGYPGTAMMSPGSAEEQQFLHRNWIGVNDMTGNPAFANVQTTAMREQMLQYMANMQHSQQPSMYGQKSISVPSYVYHDGGGSSLQPYYGISSYAQQHNQQSLNSNQYANMLAAQQFQPSQQQQSYQHVQMHSPSLQYSHVPRATSASGIMSDAASRNSGQSGNDAIANRQILDAINQAAATRFTSMQSSGTATIGSLGSASNSAVASLSASHSMQQPQPLSHISMPTPIHTMMTSIPHHQHLHSAIHQPQYSTAGNTYSYLSHPYLSSSTHGGHVPVALSQQLRMGVWNTSQQTSTESAPAIAPQQATTLSLLSSSTASNHANK